MKPYTVALCLLLAAAAAAAHGAAPAPTHGGVVAETSGDHWVELAIDGDKLVAYVLGADLQPVPSVQLGGTATVLAGGKREEVRLAPGDANSLTGTLATPVSGKAVAVLQLTVNGKATTVRFGVG